VSKEKGTASGWRPAGEWGIAVVLKDGTHGYYYVDERRRDDNGVAPQRWGRESQALRSASEEDARRYGGLPAEPTVKSYEVVRLPVRRQ
jgi:hypothetical protein